MKGCGELLAKVSEDQKKRIVSGLAAGSINLKKNLHVIGVRRITANKLNTYH